MLYIHSPRAHCSSNVQLSFYIEFIKSANCVHLLNHRKEKDLVKCMQCTYHATRSIAFDLTRVLLDDFIVAQLTKESADFHVIQMFPFLFSQNHATGPCLEAGFHICIHSLRYITSTVTAVIPKRKDTFLYLRT
jgi:hypothetical protein